MTDFITTNHGSVWNIRAVSIDAKIFAGDNFSEVEGWMGVPTNFTTDHRAARQLVEQLVVDGFSVAQRSAR